MLVRDLLGIDSDIEITGITDDSREVKSGYLFVATKGFNVDHFDYIDKAIENGCSFLVVDREISFDFPHIIVDKINQVYHELCIKYFNVDLDKFHFIGITGTDGKTTTASIIHELIKESAYIGTNGLQVLGEEKDTHNTTPCINELCEDLKFIQDRGVSTVSMEVSSEALLHDRVSNLCYDIVCFTNITGDHLNVHKTFDNYVECKKKLLKYVKKDGYVIVNGDDEILKNIKCDNKISFGFNDDNDYVISNVEYLSNGVKISVKYKDKETIIESPLHGKYNVYNVVMAYITGKHFGVEEYLLLDRIKKLSPIKGRCEFLDFGQDYDIVLDYAHTINAVSTLLDSFKDYETIITVTGAAGGREKEKRPIIGKNVIEKSTVSVFTMDDPRYEDVNEIIDQMVGDSTDYVRIPDRVEAIHYALSIAPPKSVVLIIGKGRDNYMAIEDKKVPYCDYDVIKDYFENSR